MRKSPKIPTLLAKIIMRTVVEERNLNKLLITSEEV